MTSLIIKSFFNFTKSTKLVLIRHGESVFNKQKRWAGWKDVQLSPKGIQQAKQCGKLMKQNKLIFDQAYCSVLTRSIKTLNYILDEMQLHYIPVNKCWILNQKHYGALTGQNKVDAAEKYGQAKVSEWRRGFQVRPPSVDKSDSRHPSQDRRYSQINSQLLPASENQSDVIKRVKPLWENQLLPKIQSGQNILISAHGGSLRALVKIISNLSESEIKQLNLPHTTPVVYSFSQDSFKNQKDFPKFQYLGDPQVIKKKMEKIKNQTKKDKIN